MGDASKDFNWSEFACKCGCGICNISPTLISKLQMARTEYGKAIVLNSACRCAAHNAKEGGKPDSAHLTSETEQGEAADVRVADNFERYALMKVLIKYFTRIEDAPGWLHVDVDDKKPQNTLFRK